MRYLIHIISSGVAGYASIYQERCFASEGKARAFAEGRLGLAPEDYTVRPLRTRRP